jgi:hypothetical protein
MRASFLTCILFVLYSVFLQAQDTVRVMHYNMLYYGVNNSFCNQTNNNLQLKNRSLRTIVDHVMPDIFTVNEISSNQLYHQWILDSILNVNGVTKYKRAAITNFSGTSIINGMFYDSEKFDVTDEYALVGGDRDINIYKMYYKSPELIWSTDTVFVTFIVAHLASGSDAGAQARRDVEAGLVMNHLATLPNPHNYLFQGDFNLYTSSEPAFQKMINNANQNIRLYDPVNKIGAWGNNPTFASYHTQSTHSTTNCFIGGGLDDRFDFIMVSLPVMLDTYRVKYVSGSYTIPGQDGLHFDKALIDPPVNNSAPADVIQALYDMSDHLPVVLDLRINQIPAGIREDKFQQFAVAFENPVNDLLQLDLYSLTNQKIDISLFDVSGRMMLRNSYDVFDQKNEISIPVAGLKQGIYFLNISSANGLSSTFRIVKL